MTALTIPAQPLQDAAPRPLPWRRMAWVTWRQHRATLLSVPALFGALAVFLLIAGLRIHHDYAVLTACHPFGSAHCQARSSSFNGTDWTLANTFGILLLLAPALVGAFAGAPVLARELETGTYRYAWTQGYGRTRWAIAKLVLIAVTVTAVAGAFSALWTWFFQPFLRQEDMNVLTATVFSTHGVAFAAWTLAAFSHRRDVRHAGPPDRAGHGPHPGRVPRAGAADLAGPAQALPAGRRSPATRPSSTASSPPTLPVSLGTWHSRRHAVVALHTGQPVLADAVHRGRLAAGALGAAHRGHRLAGPPPPIDVLR